MKTRTAVATAVVLLGAWCASAAHSSTQAGTMVLVGGPPSSANLAAVGARLGDGAGICLLRFDTRGQRSLRRLLRRSGLDPSVRILDLDRLPDAGLADCRSLWLAGTDAARAASGGGGWHEIVLARWHDGASLVGFDAGAAVLADRLVVAGTAGRALGRSAADSQAWPRLADGAGGLPGVLLEPRVWRRGRLGRLVAAATRNPSPVLGLGLGEDNVVAVEDNRMTILAGAPVPLLVTSDDTSATEAVTTAGTTPRTVSTLWLLGTGDQLDLAHSAPTRASTKPPLWAGAPGLRAPLRPWRGQRLAGLLPRFAASTDRRLTLGRVDATRLRLDKPWHFRAYGARDADDTFAGPFEVRLLPPTRR